METSTDAPFVQTPVATQVDGTIPTQVEAFAATRISKNSSGRHIVTPKHWNMMNKDTKFFE